MKAEQSALSERESEVLHALVRAYIANAMPIGSRILLERERWDVSSATVRNTLARLEEKGCVSQPHTSAGRVPTDRAYRMYVEEHLGTGRHLESQDRPPVEEELELEIEDTDMDRILAQLAQILGNISHQLGIVVAPQFESGVLHRVELAELAEKRLLLVVAIEKGPVRSLLIELDLSLSRDELRVVSRRLNERLHGLTMREIRGSVRQRLQELDVGNPLLLRVVAEEIENIASPGGFAVHVAGAANICLQPEFSDPHKVAGLMGLMEQRDLLTSLLRSRQGVVVTIGAENSPHRAMLECSIVTASYEVEDAVGVIGVIGPTRMPYKRMVSLVNCAASRAAGWIA